MSSLVIADKHMFQQWTIILSRFFNNKESVKKGSLSKKEETIMEMRSYTIPNSKLDTHSETDKNVTFSVFTIQVFADNNMIGARNINENKKGKRLVVSVVQFCIALSNICLLIVDTLY